jgi:hypothetical protein
MPDEEILLASKTVLDAVFVGWGMYPKTTVIACSVPLLGLGVVIVLGGQVALIVVCC